MQIAKLALASILIDTANLTAKSKTEPVDREAVEYLEAKITMVPQEAKSWDRDRFYEMMQEAKADIGGFSLGEILEKDYKQWNESGLNLGMSSVVKDLAFLVDKVEDRSFAESLDNFMSEKDLKIFAILTSVRPIGGKHLKQMLLQAKPEANDAAKAFLRTDAEDLKLEEIDLSGFESQQDPKDGEMWRNVWSRNRSNSSRKTIAPMLRAAMQR